MEPDVLADLMAAVREYRGAMFCDCYSTADAPRERVAELHTAVRTIAEKLLLDARIDEHIHAGCEYGCTDTPPEDCARVQDLRKQREALG